MSFLSPFGVRRAPPLSFSFFAFLACRPLKCGWLRRLFLSFPFWLSNPRKRKAKAAGTAALQRAPGVTLPLATRKKETDHFLKKRPAALGREVEASFSPIAREGPAMSTSVSCPDAETLKR